MSLAQFRDLLQAGGQLRELSRATEALDRAQLVVGCAARANEVGVVGVGESVRPRTRRGHDGALLEQEHRSIRTGEREDVGDRFQAFRIGNGMPTAIVHREPGTLLGRNSSEEVSTFWLCTPDLEVRRARAGERASAEKGTTDVRAAATGA